MGHSSFRLAMWQISLVVAVMCTTCIRVEGLPHPPATSAAPMMERMVEKAYDDKFDNVDLDEILNQERLLINYIKCLEGTGPCTPDAQMLKEILPDAIQTDCTKCTEKQRYGAEKVTRHLIDNRPTDWERLEKIYDPEGLYRIKYQEMKAKGNEER
ncbi:putative odorant-binding protein A10 [Drosophila eugracilis]|uniref:putative odorant-binding protein A10 n=1 Tax=Drosophila eugracilis TaxID=29029 RepID=UPI0007E84F0F|nr:putative odorant-binding protein A10 [Drosophila eugracilis]